MTAMLASTAEIRVVSGGAPREALAVLTPEPALAFIQFLSDPANRKHWKEAGFDPPGN